MATYREIKGITVQTRDTDPTINVGSWASGGSLNTPRAQLGGAGTQTSGLMFGGDTNPPASGRESALNESYNGTAYTEQADLNTGRRVTSGAGASSTAAICVGGYTGTAYSGVTETWDGSSWTEVNDLNTGRANLATVGITTAALTFGGSPPGYTADTEQWNGSSWTEKNNLNTARKDLAGAGLSTAALAFTGETPPSNKVSNNESWDGTSWTEIAEVNTARFQAAGGGTQTAALLFGGETTTVIANTESWNGSAWTEVNDLATARKELGSAQNAPNAIALASGGYSTAKTGITEEFSFPSGPHLTEGDVFISGGLTFKGFGKSAGIPAATWASGGSMNTARRGQRGAGSTTAGLVFGGGSPPPLVLTESYNGTSFTEVNDLNTAKNNGAGFGTQASAIATNEANVEIWDGTSWTETTDVNTDRTSYAGATGPTSAGIVFGGYTTTYVANVETWNGSAWTEVNDLNNARSTGGGAGLNSGDAICMLGDSNPYNSAYVETWDGTNWTEVTQANTGRYYNGASGASSSSAITYGGITSSPAGVANTESWNGSSWSEVNDLSAARFTGGSGNIGSTAASAYYAGGGVPDKTNMEEFEAENTLATITVS